MKIRYRFTSENYLALHRPLLRKIRNTGITLRVGPFAVGLILMAVCSAALVFMKHYYFLLPFFIALILIAAICFGLWVGSRKRARLANWKRTGICDADI